MNADKTTDVWSITHKEDIGAGQSVGDVTFYAYLCRVADWRLDWKKTDGGIFSQGVAESDLPDEDVEGLYLLEDGVNRNLIEAPVGYRTSGVLPAIVGKTSMPPLVVSQTLSERYSNKSIIMGGRI